MYRYENLNQALIGTCRELQEKGIRRKTRGSDCIELPEPMLIEIENPTDRYVNIKERKWNKLLPFAESLWLALGMNNLDSLPGTYVKNLYNFSDDRKHWRAGYGTRLRGYNGISTDYEVSEPFKISLESCTIKSVDQIKYVISTLNRDINSRQAIIEIGDPVKDCFDENGYLKVTKDYPCSRSLQFMVVDGKLNCTLYIRSNDVLWGFSAINVYNFTFIQEYIANILGLEVGKYYHFANNMHYYSEFENLIFNLSILNEDDYPSEYGKYQYKSKIASLSKFDEHLLSLYHYERLLVTGEAEELITIGDPLFDDWAKVFYKYWSGKRGKESKVEFINPYLNKLYYGN